MYKIKCRDCPFTRKSTDKAELATKRDAHKKNNPAHRIDWFENDN